MERIGHETGGFRSLTETTEFADGQLTTAARDGRQMREGCTVAVKPRLIEICGIDACDKALEMRNPLLPRYSRAPVQSVGASATHRSNGPAVSGRLHAWSPPSTDAVFGMTVGHSEAEPFWVEFLRSLARSLARSPAAACAG